MALRFEVFEFGCSFSVILIVLVVKVVFISSKIRIQR